HEPPAGLGSNSGPLCFRGFGWAGRAPAVQSPKHFRPFGSVFSSSLIPARRPPRLTRPAATSPPPFPFRRATPGARRLQPLHRHGRGRGACTILLQILDPPVGSLTARSFCVAPVSAFRLWWPLVDSNLFLPI
ncbi:hypothetical protein EJB05_20850, partial [Eragrostis curvula]